MSKEKVDETKEMNEEMEAQASAEEQTDQPVESEAAEEKADPSPEEQIREANDKYLRLYSEFENFRRRTAKEKLELIATASEGVIKEILPVLDDFERAIKTNETSEDISAVREGISLVHSKLYNALKSKGLEPMDSQGKEFNIDEHEALTKIPAPQEDLKGKVVDVIEKGYKINDKVIRYAKVVVGE